MNRACTHVTINDNPDFEGNETIDITITTSDAATTLDPDIGTIVIVDDDG